MTLVGRIADLLFFRNEHTCPWWFCWTFDNPVRRLIHDPRRILGGYVKEGDTVLDVGPGMGVFTIPMARMVGDAGRVIAVDLQERMLRGLMKRAGRAGVEERITPVVGGADALGVTGSPADFALVFWMLHEVRDRRGFLALIRAALKPGARLLLAEPKIHVSGKAFEASVDAALQAGFRVESRPRIAASRAVLLASPE